MGCIALVRCVLGVTLWFGWGGVLSGYHTTPAKPQQHPTRMEPEQYNP